MSPRFLWPLVMVVGLVGCGEPPGTPKPLPLDYQEETRAIEAYRRIHPRLMAIDGVADAYLSANNNPRRLVVVVRHEAAAQAVRAQIGERVEGMSLKFQDATVEPPEDTGPIRAVPTVETPTTWWGQVLFYLQTLQFRLLGGEKR